jgi:hypothetical protein
VSDCGLLKEGLFRVIVLKCIMINLFYILVGSQVVKRDEVVGMLRYLGEIR